MTIKTVTFTLNGTTTTLTKGTDGTYTGTITAPTATSGSNNSGQGPGVGTDAKSKGYYGGSVTATDDAGNSTTVDYTDATLGDSLKLEVIEKTAPVAAFTSPGDGSYLTSSAPTIKFTVTDSGSGVNPSKVYINLGGSDILLDSGSVSISGSTATCEYTPTTALTNGAHTISVYGYDYDGNKSNVASVKITIDTVAPTLNISSPADDLTTNSTNLTVSGTTNDATSSPVTITIKVGSASAVTADVSDGAFSKTVTLSEGTNTIVVTAEDKAGLKTTVTRTVTVDTTAPTITAIEIAPNPVDGGATYTVKVTVTD